MEEQHRNNTLLAEGAGDAARHAAAHRPLCSGDRLPAWRRAIRAQLLGPFRPRKALANVADVSLPLAFATHVLTVALGALTFFLFWTAAIYFTDRLVNGSLGMQQQYPTYIDLVTEGLGGFLNAMWNAEFWAALGIIAISVESCLLALAFLVTAWGAIEEPIRQSWKHALRTVWLMTSLAFWWLTVLAMSVGITILTIERYRRIHLQSVPWTDHPWICRNAEIFPIAGITLGSLAVLRVLIRGVSARRGSPPAYSSLCESCGYDLSHTPLDSRCPECGEPVLGSLGPDVRGPTAWERSPCSLVAYLSTMRHLLLKPATFFKQMSTQTGLDAALRFAWINLISTAVICFLGALAVQHAIFQVPFPTRDVHLYLMLPLLTAVASLAFTGLMAGVGGLATSSQAGRNRLAAVGKASLYSTALYPPLVTLSMLLWTGLLEGVQRLLGLPQGILPFLRRSGFDQEEQIRIIMLLVLVAVLYRIVRYNMEAFRGVRYANT